MTPSEFGRIALRDGDRMEVRNCPDTGPGFVVSMYRDGQWLHAPAIEIEAADPLSAVTYRVTREARRLGLDVDVEHLDPQGFGYRFTART
jgi:hypothetical protein